jgi:transcriptional regulator with GAF, ATPase, and Fis domain
MVSKKIDANKIRGQLDKALEELVRAYMLKNFADEIIPLNDFMDMIEKEVIRYALLISEDNQKKSAFLLNLKPPTLCEKMKRYDIKLDNSLKQTALPFLRSLEEIGRLMEPEEEE